MKRLLFLFVILVSTSTNSLSYGAELAPEGSAARKLQRGFLNVALAPIEISTEIERQKDKKRWDLNPFLGVVNGTIAAAGRAAVGVFEMVTAPVSLGKENDPILKPEFGWENFGIAENQESPSR